MGRNRRAAPEGETQSSDGNRRRVESEATTTWTGNRVQSQNMSGRPKGKKGFSRRAQPCSQGSPKGELKQGEKQNRPAPEKENRMNQEQLATIRAHYSDQSEAINPGHNVTVSALLDHIAQLEARADESSATMERLSGVVERYRGGMQPSSAERCTLRWSHSSATDRGSFERGWEAREAEGLEARSEGEQGTTGERNDNGRDEGMKIESLDQIESVRVQWSESGLINRELGNDAEGDINVTISPEAADDLIRRAAILVDGGYDKTPLTVTLKDGTVWCHELKFYILRRTTGLLDLINEQ